MRVVSETTFAPTTDAEEKLRNRLPKDDPEIVKPADGYGVVAYVLCDSAEEERNAALSVVGEFGVRKLVDKLRWFLAVHSYIYYEHGKTVCSDATWDRKAKKLVKLQDVFGVEAGTWESETFEGFEGDTGYHLPKTEAVKREAIGWIEESDE